MDGGALTSFGGGRHRGIQRKGGERCTSVRWTGEVWGEWEKAQLQREFGRHVFFLSSCLHSPPHSSDFFLRMGQTQLFVTAMLLLANGKHWLLWCHWYRFPSLQHLLSDYAFYYSYRENAVASWWPGWDGKTTMSDHAKTSIFSGVLGWQDLKICWNLVLPTLTLRPYVDETKSMALCRRFINHVKVHRKVLGTSLFSTCPLTLPSTLVVW